MTTNKRYGRGRAKTVPVDPGPLFATQVGVQAKFFLCTLEACQSGQLDPY